MEYVDEKSFNKHIKVVHLEGTQVCPYCGKQVGQVSRHIWEVHSKELKFECSKCEYKTYTKRQLTRHVQSVHEGIRYDCSLCGKSVFNLRDHTKFAHEKY